MFSKEDQIPVGVPLGLPEKGYAYVYLGVSHNIFVKDFNGIHNRVPFTAGTAGYMPKTTDHGNLLDSPMFVDGSNNVAVGHSTPNAKLDVQDTFGLRDGIGTKFYIDATGGNGAVVNLNDSLTSKIRFSSDAAIGSYYVPNISFGHSADPTATLDIVGGFRLRTGSEAAGFVLSTDINGNADWVDITDIFPGDVVTGASSNDGRIAYWDDFSNTHIADSDWSITPSAIFRDTAGGSLGSLTRPLLDVFMTDTIRIDSSSTFTIGDLVSTYFSVDKVNDRVGIRTATPATSFHSVGDFRFDTPLTSNIFSASAAKIQSFGFDTLELGAGDTLNLAYGFNGVNVANYVKSNEILTTKVGDQTNPTNTYIQFNDDISYFADKSGIGAINHRFTTTNITPETNGEKLFAVLNQNNEKFNISADGRVQIGNDLIGVADNSAILDLISTDKGILLPRLTTVQRGDIISPATGLIIYNSDSNKFNFYNGTSWNLIASGTSNFVTTSGSVNRIPKFNSLDITILEDSSIIENLADITFSKDIIHENELRLTGITGTLTGSDQFLGVDGSGNVVKANVSSMFAANNGTTYDMLASSFKLGGDLIEDTIIGGQNSYKLEIGVTGNLVNEFYSNSSTKTAFKNVNVNEESGIEIAGGYTTLKTLDGTITSEISARIDRLFFSIGEVGNLIQIGAYTIGQVVANNGSNNHIVVLDQYGDKGIVMAADYSSNFTNESVVTKRFVNNTLAGYVALTGTTPSGEITGDLEFTGATSLKTNFISGYAELQLDNVSSAMILNYNDGTDTSRIAFSNSNNIQIFSTKATFEGLVYAVDYSANYTDRSLVDFEYVNSIAGGTASNGLSYSGNNTTLGGLLTTNTTINGDNTYIFTIANAAVSIETAYNNLVMSASNTAFNRTLDAFHLTELNLQNTSGSLGIWDLTLGLQNILTFESNHISIDLNANQTPTYSWGGLRITDIGLGMFWTDGDALNLSGIATKDTTYAFDPTLVNLTIRGVNGVGIYTTNSTTGLVQQSLVFSETPQTNPDLSIDNHMVITDDSFLKGLVYAADYAANFSPNSIVSRKYVDDAITAAELTFDNGVTRTLNNVQLGGELIQNTSFTGDFTFDLVMGDIANVYSQLNVVSTQASMWWGDNAVGNGANISVNSSGTTLNTTNLLGTLNNTFFMGSAGTSITNNGTNNHFFIKDDIASKGIVYFADYSANFTFESLVSKRYVDAAVSGGSGTASNGITKVVNDYKLGGALTAATNITGAFTLSLGTNASRLGSIVGFGTTSVTLTAGSSATPTIFSKIGMTPTTSFWQILNGAAQFALNATTTSLIYTFEGFVDFITINQTGTVTADTSADNFFVVNDAYFTKGLQYADYYEGAFTDLSLVTKYYVDNAIAGGTPATNGLNVGVGGIGLGAALTENTIISGGAFWSFGIQGIKTLELSSNGPLATTSLGWSDGGVTNYSDIIIGAGSMLMRWVDTTVGSGSIQLSSTTNYFSHTYVAVDSFNAEIILNNDINYFGVKNNTSGIYNTIQISRTGQALHASVNVVNQNAGVNQNRQVIRDDIFSKGLVYYRDYSALFTPESLVSKRYVDSVAGGTASNGITKVVNDYKWGGTLTGTTTVTQAGFGISFSGGNFQTSTTGIGGDFGFYQGASVPNIGVEGVAMHYTGAGSWQGITVTDGGISYDAFGVGLNINSNITQYPGIFTLTANNNTTVAQLELSALSGNSFYYSETGTNSGLQVSLNNFTLATSDITNGSVNILGISDVNPRFSLVITSGIADSYLDIDQTDGLIYKPTALTIGFQVTTTYNVLANKGTGVTNTMFGVSGRTNISLDNTGLGYNSLGALAVSGDASGNVSIGSYSMSNLTTGDNNVVVGYNTATNLTTGSNNIILGANIGNSLGNVSNEFAIANNPSRIYLRATGINVFDGYTTWNTNHYNNQSIEGNASSAATQIASHETAWIGNGWTGGAPLLVNYAARTKFIGTNNLDSYWSIGYATGSLPSHASYVDVFTVDGANKRIGINLNSSGKALSLKDVTAYGHIGQRLGGLSQGALWLGDIPTPLEANYVIGGSGINTFINTNGGTISFRNQHATGLGIITTAGLWKFGDASTPLAYIHGVASSGTVPTFMATPGATIPTYQQGSFGMDSVTNSFWYQQKGVTLRTQGTMFSEYGGTTFDTGGAGVFGTIFNGTTIGTKTIPSSNWWTVGMVVKGESRLNITRNSVNEIQFRITIDGAVVATSDFANMVATNNDAILQWEISCVDSGSYRVTGRLVATGITSQAAITPITIVGGLPTGVIDVEIASVNAAGYTITNYGTEITLSN